MSAKSLPLEQLPDPKDLDGTSYKEFKKLFIALHAADKRIQELEAAVATLQTQIAPLL